MKRFLGLINRGQITPGVPAGLRDASNVAIIGGSVENVTIASKIVEKSASGSLTAAECTGTRVMVYGQTDNLKLDLAAAFANGSFTIEVTQTVAGKYIRIAPNGSEVQALNGTDLTAGYYIGMAEATKGTTLTYKAIKTGATSYQWMAYSVTGTWVAESV